MSLSPLAAPAAPVQVAFEGVLDEVRAGLPGSPAPGDAFSGAIVYPTDDVICPPAGFGMECVFDDGRASLGAELGGQPPDYQTDVADPRVSILLQSYFADRYSGDPVPFDDPNGVLRQTFAASSLVNLDLGVGDYEILLLLERDFPLEPPIYSEGGSFGAYLLQPSAVLAAQLVGARFELRLGGEAAPLASGYVGRASVIPEPATAGLLLGGLAALAARCRRR